MGSLSNCALWQSWLSCMHTYQMLSAGTYFKVTAASKMDFLGTVLLDQVKTVSSLLVHGQDQADNVIWDYSGQPIDALCTHSRNVNVDFFSWTLFKRDLRSLFFLWHCLKEISEVVHGYNIYWALSVHSSLGDIDLFQGHSGIRSVKWNVSFSRLVLILASWGVRCTTSLLWWSTLSHNRPNHHHPPPPRPPAPRINTVHFGKWILYTR